MRPTAPPLASAFPGRLEGAQILAMALLLAGRLGKECIGRARACDVPNDAFARRFEDTLDVTVQCAHASSFALLQGQSQSDVYQSHRLTAFNRR
jgi:hypothetical protein